MKRFPCGFSNHCSTAEPLIFRTGAISYLFQEVDHLVIIPFKFDMT